MNNNRLDGVVLGIAIEVLDGRPSAGFIDYAEQFDDSDLAAQPGQGKCVQAAESLSALDGAR